MKSSTILQQEIQLVDTKFIPFVPKAVMHISAALEARGKRGINVERLALVLQQFQYLIEDNERKGSGSDIASAKVKDSFFHDGHWWTLGSYKHFAEKWFTWLDEEQLRKAIRWLVDLGYLITKQYKRGLQYRVVKLPDAPEIETDDQPEPDENEGGTEGHPEGGTEGHPSYISKRISFYNILQASDDAMQGLEKEFLEREDVQQAIGRRKPEKLETRTLLRFLMWREAILSQNPDAELSLSLQRANHAQKILNQFSEGGAYLTPERLHAGFQRCYREQPGWSPPASLSGLENVMNYRMGKGGYASEADRLRKLKYAV